MITVLSILWPCAFNIFHYVCVCARAHVCYVASTLAQYGCRFTSVFRFFCFVLVVCMIWCFRAGLGVCHSHTEIVESDFPTVAQKLLRLAVCVTLNHRYDAAWTSCLSDAVLLLWGCLDQRPDRHYAATWVMLHCSYEAVETGKCSPRSEERRVGNEC